MDKYVFNMPAGASEAILKTAGKTCEKDIHVTAPFSHRTEKGTFTPTTNSFDKFTITGIPTDCRFVEIAHITPVSTVDSDGVSAGLIVPITHAAWVGAITKRDDPANVGFIEYTITGNTKPYGGAKATVKLESDGLTFTLSGLGASFAFEADVTYEWTAHFYDD